MFLSTNSVQYIQIRRDYTSIAPPCAQRDTLHQGSEGRDNVHRVHVQYRVIRLSELNGQEILDAGQAGLIAFAPLMRPPQGMASRAWLRHCMHAAHTRPMVTPSKADYLAGMSLLSGLVYAPETISEIVSKEGTMDLIRESSFAQYLTRQGVVQGIEQGIEQALSKGSGRVSSPYWRFDSISLRRIL